MRIFDELFGLVSSKVNIFKTLMVLLKLEARLAGMSVFPLLVNICLLFVIFISTWILTIILIGFGIYQFYPNAWVALGSVFGFNLIVLGILVKYLLFNLKKMTFEKTRKFWSNRGNSNELKLKKKGVDSGSRDRKEVVSATGQS